MNNFILPDISNNKIHKIRSSFLVEKKLYIGYKIMICYCDPNYITLYKYYANAEYDCPDGTICEVVEIDQNDYYLEAVK